MTGARGIDPPASRAVLLQLRNTLATLYPTNERALEIAAQVGLAVARIAQSSRPESTWWSVVVEADRQLVLRQLVALVREEYPHQDGLPFEGTQDCGLASPTGTPAADPTTSGSAVTRLQPAQGSVASELEWGATTPATVSFVGAQVRFRCSALGIDEQRQLGSPLFSAWTEAYSTGHWSAQALQIIGLAIGRWLDGEQLWLTRLLAARGPIVLVIEVPASPGELETAALDVPWELIALVGDELGGPLPAPAVSGAPPLPDSIARLLAALGGLGAAELARVRHLALDERYMLTPVRRFGPAQPPPLPSTYRLSVTFMAAQPDGVARFDMDQEETAIRSMAGAVDLAVDDSGSLEGLAEVVAQVTSCDVIHLSCHGAFTSEPVLVLEDQRGHRLDVTAGDIAAGIGMRPPLLFMAVRWASPCPEDVLTDDLANLIAANASSVTTGSKVLWPLAATLCRRGWPTVIAWSCRPTDLVAVTLATDLYRRLALRVPLVEAFAYARCLSSNGAWHTARLVMGPTGGGKLVDGTAVRPDQVALVRPSLYLDPATREIGLASPEQAFPYRRALQQAMAAVRSSEYSGVVVHGGDAVGRATFAAHVLRRIEPYRPRVIVASDFDPVAILAALREQTANTRVAAIFAEYGPTLARTGELLQALREILEGPCRNSGHGAVTLIVHGFGPIGATGPRGQLSADGLLVARALAQAFTVAQTESRLLFTCERPFAIPVGDSDLANSLLAVSLNLAASS